MPVSRQKSASRPPSWGADRSVAAGVDFENIPVAIGCRQLPMSSPKIRTGTPAARRWAAIDRP
ncbi:hypothetical protein [Streptomyces sp. OV198]|uniref:hypothetical protein n=1 Tax=Streptomyces sp. OV198 TaxID=1882787 RepID=UPI0015CF20E8|nr:hypothetical protein [Streptomyces sp. OV198]